MRARHPPRLWLMTDERMGNGLLPAVARLPRGSGIVFRHYATPPAERRALFDAVRAIARRRAILLLLGGGPRLAAAWRADGAHGRSPHRSPRAMLRSAPAHDLPELWRAQRQGADLVFVSPLFATRSHPDAKALGRVGAGRLARQSPVPVIALGGMTPARARGLGALGFAGWAAIDWHLRP